MKIIGITGGTGTGKTTALEAVEYIGGIGVDADEIYHGLLLSSENMIKEIDGVFPGVVENGSLNRKKLGEIVFNDKSKLLALNKVTHKYICGEIDRIIEKEKRRNSKYLAIDAIELIESGVSQLCDIVIAVTAPIKMRIARIMAREGISMAYAAMRISAQKPDTYYNEHCDKVICNDFDDREKFKEFCINMFKNILED